MENNNTPTNWETWAKHKIRYSEAQLELESSLKLLHDRYFISSGEYVVEKFCRSFCESIQNLQELLEDRSGRSGIFNGEVWFAGNDEEIIENINEILKREIMILAFNYDVFLSSLRENK